MVWPAEVVELDDLTYFSVKSFVEHFELASDQVLHQTLARDEHNLDVMLVFVEREALSNLGWPVLIALDLSVFFCFRQVDDEPRVLLVHHAPEVFLGLWQRSLSGDEGLVIGCHC